MRCYEAPKSGHKYQHRPGAYGVFLQKGQILLTYQAGIHNEWQLPGGGVDKGESFAQALIREAHEETGWKVSIERKIAVYRRFVYMPEYDISAEKICHIYIGRALWRMGDALETDHSDALINIQTAIQLLADIAGRNILKGLSK